MSLRPVTCPVQVMPGFTDSRRRSRAVYSATSAGAAHQGHLADQHIPQLRQFVDRRLAGPGPRSYPPGHPRHGGDPVPPGYRGWTACASALKVSTPVSMRLRSPAAINLSSGVLPAPRPARGRPWNRRYAWRPPPPRRWSWPHPGRGQGDRGRGCQCPLSGDTIAHGPESATNNR